MLAVSGTKGTIFLPLQIIMAFHLSTPYLAQIKCKQMAFVALFALIKIPSIGLFRTRVYERGVDCSDVVYK